MKSQNQSIISYNRVFLLRVILGYLVYYCFRSIFGLLGEGTENAKVVWYLAQIRVP